MCFNGTGIWGGETLHLIINRPISSPDGGGGCSPEVVSFSTWRQSLQVFSLDFRENVCR